MLPSQYNAAHMDEPVIAYARTDLPLLPDKMTIGEALDFILQQGVGEKIVYFYVVDDLNRLLGVLPTRRLLVTPRDVKISDVMISRIVKLPNDATIMDACEVFVLHKFLALPIVDSDNTILGMVDINLFTNEMLNMDTRSQIDQIFETIGFSFKDVKNASPFKAFRYRFPWLLTTITSGIMCAILSGVFEATIAKSIIISFFMALLLGLGESVSIQSMTLTIQMLNIRKPTGKWFWRNLKKEAFAAFLLGSGCGATVALIVLLWKGLSPVTFVIGASVMFSLILACITGLCIPTFLHFSKLDPKIASGPITLAISDVCTLSIYFTLAMLIL
jgi:magnesium transporter